MASPGQAAADSTWDKDKMRIIPDKSWIDIPRIERYRDRRYKDGCEAFMKYAEMNPNNLESGAMYCPCCRCKNMKLKNREEIRSHLINSGFYEEYKCWSYHGENKYRDTESSQKGSTNRHSKRKLDRHLGSTSFANLEYGYCRDMGKPIMPVNLKAKLAYGTFRSTYKDEVKIKENMLLVDSIDAASKEAALRATQGEPDPHILSREENDAIVMKVMGNNKRGRFPLMGVGARRGTSKISSTVSSRTSPSLTAKVSSTRIPTTSTILRVSCYLRGKIDPALLMQLTKAMFSNLPADPTMDKVFTQIVLCLSDKIPAELFGEVLSLIDLDTSAQAGLAGGSSSGVQRRVINDDNGS